MAHLKSAARSPGLSYAADRARRTPSTSFASRRGPVAPLTLSQTGARFREGIPKFLFRSFRRLQSADSASRPANVAGASE
jgi:hypothetical protein